MQNYTIGQYLVDPAHSKVGFEIAHLVISSVEGRFTDFEGTIDLTEKFENSQVTASANIKSIDTSMPKRDEHLKSADFFHAEKFPKMTFKSSKIEGSPQKFKLIGNLTIRGITKKVTFEGTFLGIAEDGYGNEKVAFDVSTKISRKEFGLN